MTVIKREAMVSHTPGQMYDLVNDIERYPEFLQWCAKTDVHSRTDDEIRATLSLAWGGLQKSFTTLNRLQKDKMIELRLLDGPFHHLEGFWRFEHHNTTGCKVSLDMEFEFAGKLISMAFGPIFSQVANSLVDAFCKRAQQLHGSGE